MIPIFIPLALFATLIFGLSSIVNKLLIPRVGGGLQFLTLQMSVGVPIISIVYVVMTTLGSVNHNPLTNPINLMLLGLASAFTFLGFVFLNIGLAKGNSSVAGVVLSARVMITIPLAVIFVNEFYRFQVYLSIFVAFLGAVLVSYRQDLPIGKIIRFQAEGLRYFFGTIFFWAVGGLFIRLLENQIPIILFIGIRQFIFAFFAILVYIIGRRQHNIPAIKINKLSVILTSFFMIFILASQMAFVYAIGEALTLTDAITSFQGVITLIVSFLFAKFWDNTQLDEPLDLKSVIIRTVGAILATSGTLGVIFYST